MSSGDEQSDEETVPLFRPFTKESLAAIEARIAEANARKAERDRLKAEGDIGPDGVPEHYSIPHHEERLEPDPGLEVGMPLPRALAPDFPPELIATPIEDLDKYYENERVSPSAFFFDLSSLGHESAWIIQKDRSTQTVIVMSLLRYKISCKISQR
ncbi:hypothetical protein AVEN_130521-1 [Araneus ventricosus]|uniref:Sodium channel protein para n=1 Tax=Araneus ventricosus TaxID=182803 RepID=A0A4Y2ELL9_ARAVE|nr:hypothetical protein AVEN_130521-1 [Araneus ventricosus]